MVRFSGDPAEIIRDHENTGHVVQGLGHSEWPELHTSAKEPRGGARIYRVFGNICIKFRSQFKNEKDCHKTTFQLKVLVKGRE